MTIQDTLNSWFTTYADGRSHVEAVARLSDDTWGVALEGPVEITATLDEPGKRLGIVVSLGTLPGGERRARLMEGLLEYSLMWRRTGGVRGAMASGNEALLIVELFLPDLSESSLHSALDNMAVKARTFIQIIAGADDSSVDSGPMIRI